MLQWIKTMLCSNNNRSLCIQINDDCVIVVFGTALTKHQAKPAKMIFITLTSVMEAVGAAGAKIP